MLLLELYANFNSKNIKTYGISFDSYFVFFSGRGPCKSYSAEDRSSIDNEEDCAELQDIGDDQVKHKYG